MDYLSHFKRHRNLILPISLIGCIGVLLVPLPPAMMDILLAGNIAVSLIVLLTTISVRRPIEFSIFPTLLVAATLGRLVLNVGTTRLILSGAASGGQQSVGGMIEAFGNFVAGDHLVIGVVIFAIIVAIQFLVITKGATRISEVAARFALDGMPGRQMAIDADLNSGAIDENEARARRAEVAEQADFYGAMDGASKFVRGDAVAGILITLINIVGGLCLGILTAGMSPAQAADAFTRLTIGDGLASQIPAFLISIAAAVLVTRSSQRVDLPTEFLDQVFSHPQVLAIAGGFLGLLVFTNLPTIPLLVLGAACVGLAILLSKGQAKERLEAEAEQQRRVQVENARPKPTPEELITVDPMRIELGANLIRLAAPTQGGDLMEQVSEVRNRLASEMGFLLPKVRVKDNFRLDPNAYAVYVAGNVIAEGFVPSGGPHTDSMLAIDTGHCRNRIESEHFVEPVSGRPAVWVDSNHAGQAESFGYQLWRPGHYIARHLDAVSRQYSGELLTREQTNRLVEQLRKQSPAIVEELIPEAMRLSKVQQVLRLLLEEDIPIRQLDLIFETLCDYADSNMNVYQLAQQVRNRLARTISSRFADERGVLHAIGLAPSLEDEIAAQLPPSSQAPLVRWAPEQIESFCSELQAMVGKRGSRSQVVLVRPNIRFAVHGILSGRLPHVPVLSHSELSLHLRVETTGTVTGQPNSLAAA